MKGILGSTKRRDDVRASINEIISLYQSGLTAEKIGKRFKIVKAIILKLLRENGIERRKAAPPKGRIPWNKGLNQFTDKRVLKWSGINNVNWKGGVTPLNMKVRRCKKYLYWVKDVFLRDNWTCRTCNKRGGELEVDHYPILFSEIMKSIKTFDEAMYCEKLWDLSNGRTLCLPCHNKTKRSFKTKKIQ